MFVRKEGGGAFLNSLRYQGKAPFFERKEGGAAHF